MCCAHELHSCICAPGACTQAECNVAEQRWESAWSVSDASCAPLCRGSRQGSPG
jgi:hypothetical protein